jgi:hypothetical protein
MIMLEISFRGPENLRQEKQKLFRHTGRNGDVILVPITHAWTEGADDLHVHFANADAGYMPHLSATTGDWIAPHPSIEWKLARVYSLLFQAIDDVTPSRFQIAGSAYVRRLRRAWYSGNCDSPNYSKTLAFERQLKRIYGK